MQKILILDANQRSTLSVVRSLGKHKDIFILTASEMPEALAGHSAYSQSHHQYPSPISDPSGFCSWLTNFTSAEHIEAIYPTTEITSQLVLMHKSHLAHCKIPFADYETVMSIANKGELLTLAKNIGIPHPNTRYFSNSNDINTSSIDNFPVVVKPCLSSIWLGDRWLESSVHIVNSRNQLEDLLNNLEYLKDHPFLLQEFIPGHGAGIFALYDNGAPITFFAHERIREKPPSGGVSVLSASRPCDPNQLKYAKSLLDAVKWHGVAMVEFRITPEGKAYLMEVNTRFWGSLQLSIDAGVDFPYLLHQANFGLHPQPVSDYKLSKKLRWLLGDLDSLYLALKSDSSFSFRDKALRILQFLLPHKNTRHEINRLEDMGPAWFEIKQYCKQLFGN